MIDVAARKRVLVIGAGFRAANNFFPSFRLRSDLFEIVGVHAQSMVRARPLGERWNVPSYASLADVDPTGVDVVALTVPTSQNSRVLDAVLRWNDRVELVIDTPIAANYGEYRALTPLLRRFRSVVVTEDFMNFPQFELARRAAGEGLLGSMRSVTLFNTGYRYHGLALLRSFAGFAPVVRTTRMPLGSYASVLSFRFAGGVSGSIVGPYRQDVTGGIVVEGDRAVITQAPEDALFADINGRAVHRLASEFVDGRLSAFTIDHSPYRVDLPEIALMAEMPFEDQTVLNVLKNVGLTKIFGALSEPNELNRAYGFENGLYDSFASRFAANGWLRFDPLARFGRDFMAIPRFAVTRSLSPIPTA